ncbi:MarR family winged helix-turn-helix transcriptional regulator [Reinekea marinisedimentorum]|uniref:DNA-binding MarR family transcriptional regulator n=1 Tax=Reinekea marinisedimentorum TaxID=230495 RepID=A0A4R3HT31_9GAMM|nr:MarR family winged helix-turn-helix transcriptional regulator [Reinekea marinisedimentorum]TCS36128.1 DNA-binding MarR family transcriptional regulator [Reinekea marinisedimentorum]
MKPKREKIETVLARRHWEKQGRAAPPIAVLVHSLHEQFSEDLMQRLEPHGVQFSDWGALTTLYHSGEPYCQTPTEICHGMLFTSGAISKILVRLERLGMVERVENPEDQRSKLAKLTAKGLNCVRTVQSQLKDIEHQQLKGLNKEELNTLEQLLTKLHNNWES